MLRLLIAVAMGLGLGVACGGEDENRHLPPPGDGDADSDADSDGDGDADGDADGGTGCYDEDGDGYGPFCGPGEDCDDLNADVHDFADCTSCPAGVPYKNCPCFGTEDPVPCHSQDLYCDEHERLRCRVGTRRCVESGETDTGFAWTACLDASGLDVDTTPGSHVCN